MLLAEDLLALLVPGLYVRLLDRLTARGLFVRSTRTFTFGVLSKTVWRVTDGSRAEELRRRLAGPVLGRTPPDQWSGMLIGLLYAVDAIKELRVEGSPETDQRVAEIADGDWPAGEVTKAIAAKSFSTLASKSHILDSVITFPG